jgi:hypothetical protein
MRNWVVEIVDEPTGVVSWAIVIAEDEYDAQIEAEKIADEYRASWYASAVVAEPDGLRYLDQMVEV